jgi:Spy/CpxP family protein refolding chaperone
MKRNLRLILATILVMGSVSVCMAETDAPFKRGKEFRELIIKELGLSKDQQSKMQRIGKSFRDKIKDHRKVIREIREEKLQMLLSGNVDMKRMEELDGQYMKHHTVIDQERLNMKRERLKVLKGDQVQKLGKILEERRDKIRQRFKRRAQAMGLGK